MGRLVYLFVLVLMLFPSLKTTGQDFGMLHYTVENGIPSNTIYNVSKDSKGYLWLCSDKGIVRYNGIKFEIFTTFDGMPDNEIFFFGEDNMDRLWLATYNGELCYYKDDTFHTAANTPFLKLPFKKTFIQDIIAADDGSVIIGFSDHSKWVNFEGEKRTIRNFGKVIPSFDAGYFYANKISKNKYEIMFYNRKLIVDSNSNILNEEVFPDNKQYRYSTAINQQYLYSADSIYTLDFRPIAKTNKTAYFNTRIYHIHRFGTDIFYCTDKGLFINDSLHLLKDVKVSGVVQDNKGNYWISTLGNGLYSLGKDFREIKKHNNLYTGTVKYSFADSNNTYFATSNNNLFRFNNDTTKCLFDFSTIRPGKRSANYQSNFIDCKYNYYGLFDNYITVINAINSVAPEVKMYYGDFRGGYKTLELIGQRLYLKRFRSIEYIDFEAYKNTLSAQFEGLPVLRLSTLMNSTERVFGMAKAPDNTLLYSTIDSMYHIIDGKAVYQPQFKDISLRWFEIADNYLIGCTDNNKLVIYNIVTCEMKYDIATGENCIWDKLYVLDSSHYLLSTDNLHRILTLNTSNNKTGYSVLVVENPYIPAQCDDICSNGTVCFFFKNGSVTSIDIKNLFSRPEPPEMFFRQLKTSEKSFPIHDNIEIPFSQSRNISISFSTLAINSRHISCQYLISGTDEEAGTWIDITGDINLIRPRPGTYTIKIRAKSISSDYSEPITLTIDILSPFWTKWWFILCVAGLVVLIVILLIRYRVSSMLHVKQQKHENEIRFIRSEYKALNALMNPHFIFNTLNNVQDLINKNDKHAANEYLRFFADLIRQNMNNISKELIPLQKEIDLVVNYLLLEKLRFEDLLNYTINIEDDLDLSEIMVPPLLIQPLVENSIKHGIYPLQSTEGHICINIRDQKGIIYIEVMDNGIGIDHSKNRRKGVHESFGLENIRKRIEQLNIIQDKKITFRMSETRDEQGRHKWTVVTISLPLAA